MPDDRELDHLLDTALSTYAEPREGLEARVLANLSARPTRRWLPWIIALPIAACLLLLLTLYPRHDRTEPVRQAQHNPTPQMQPTPQSSTAQAALEPVRPPQPRTSIAHATRTAPAPLPKLDVFPTPQPLSSQERALIRYVAHIPEPDRRALAAAEDQPIAPLAIAAIQIHPLEPLDKSEN
ncbi:hypothetical protein [Terracidiphilus gabretensis]|uniref:hypothetical protein n=1 Tax=Terracidiphilus gabretensis TaxID=1577687 RepID=UPI00071B7987|nr:hypothetical protein [Terracidiphilus gabretensis]